MDKAQGTPLRLKLTLWFVAVFAVAQLALGVMGALFRSSVLPASLDEVLQDRSQRVASLLVAADSPITSVRLAAHLDRAQDSELFQQVGLAVFDERGALVASAGELSPAPGASPERLLELEDFTAVLEDRSDDAEGGLLAADLRVASVRYTDGDGQRWLLQLSARPLLLQDARRFLEEYLLLALPLSLVAAGLVGWFLVGRALQPLRAISRAARELRAETLPQRIQVTATGTEIEDLQRQLNGALDRLHAAFEAQSQFISVVSHELKTPMAVLLTEAQILRQQQASVEELRAFAESVEQEMRRLAGMVESFLSLARAEHMRSLPRREEVPLSDVVVEAVRRASPVGERRGVRIVTQLAPGPDDHLVMGDPELLEVLVMNLLRNAVGHSEPGTAVDIQTADADGGIELRVRDRGPGIPKDVMPVLFQPFYRGPDGGGRRRGTGLGLAITRRLVDLHGGTIGVANEAGGGCTFRVWLPHALRPPRAGRRREGRVPA